MSDIQIGLSKSARRTFALDDVALVPTRRTRDRRDVDTSWQIDAFRFDTPIVGGTHGLGNVPEDRDRARAAGRAGRAEPGGLVDPV